MTPYPASFSVLSDARGGDVLVVAVKVTVDGRGSPSTDPSPVVTADRFDDRGMLVAPGDIAVTRTGTSVAVRGAITDGASVTRGPVNARVQIGTIAADLLGFAPRRWRRSGSAFEAVAIEDYRPVVPTFDVAFGGSSGAMRFQDNPVGRGYWEESSGVDPTEVDLPLVEYSGGRLGSPGDRVAPAAFGWVPPSWSPRREYAGTYDAAWLEREAPLLPRDFDERFYDVAPRPWVLRPPLRGGETIETTHMGVPGTYRAQVPRVRVRIKLPGLICVPQIDMLEIDPLRDRLTLTLRSSVPVRFSGAASFPILVRELRVIGRSSTTWA